MYIQFRYDFLLFNHIHIKYKKINAISMWPWTFAEFVYSEMPLKNMNRTSSFTKSQIC